MRTRRLLLASCAALVAASAVPSSAAAGYSAGKSIWGPVSDEAFSLFGTYSDLGVGVYQLQVRWNEVAPRRPKDPTNPRDRAYRWPAAVDYALGETAGTRMKVALTVTRAPAWANGRTYSYAPRDSRDYARFLTAIARRYPTIRLWRIWEEPSTGVTYKPVRGQTRGNSLGPKQAAAPRRYALMLDRAYAALKRVDRRNQVIGGNTVTYGAISPRNWIRYMRLPDGSRPRMDLFGHSPYSLRLPDEQAPSLGRGFADISTLDELEGWVDRWIGRPPGSKQRMKLFLARYYVPSDHATQDFPVFVSREEQARWLTAAYRITRANPRVKALGWSSLYDSDPFPGNAQPEWGLVTYPDGDRKPAYDAYRRAR